MLHNKPLYNYPLTSLIESNWDKFLDNFGLFKFQYKYNNREVEKIAI